jgi:hypothetical protein
VKEEIEISGTTNEKEGKKTVINVGLPVDDSFININLPGVLFFNVVGNHFDLYLFMLIQIKKLISL